MTSHSSRTKNILEDVLKSFDAVGVHNTDRLKSHLEDKNGNNPDSYLSSPTYFLFTGRKGLWLHNKGLYLLCLHPNRDDEVLVFPTTEDYKALAEALEPLYGVRDKIKLGKIEVTQAPRMEQELNLHGSLKYTSQDEDSLDWRFPIHIVDPGFTSSMFGSVFRHLRRKIAKMSKRHKAGFSGEPANFKDPLPLLLFVKKWAEAYAAAYPAAHMGEDEFFAPYNELIGLGSHGNLPIHGMVFKIDGEIVGLSIWEIDPQKGVANVFASICLKDFTGLSETQDIAMLKQLRADGIQHVNIGGSELLSLDTYKRKFLPKTSIQQCSIVAQPS